MQFLTVLYKKSKEKKPSTLHKSVLPICLVVAEKTIMAIANYNKMVFLIGVAYASSDVAGKTIMAIVDYTNLVLFMCGLYFQ